MFVFDLSYCALVVRLRFLPPERRVAQSMIGLDFQAPSQIGTNLDKNTTILSPALRHMIVLFVSARFE